MTRTTATSDGTHLAPFVLGDNNVWPLPLAESEGGGWLLVDAGVDYEDAPGVTSWDLLQAQVHAAGIDPREVRVVVVTHEHIDHAGLAGHWAEIGARIVVGRAGIAAVVLGGEANDRQRDTRLRDLARHGAPPEAIATWRAQRRPRAWRWPACPADAIAAAEECDPFRLVDGRTLSLLMTPGHTPGNLVALVPETGELFSGDTIIPTTIPTAGLHYPGAILGDPDAPRWPSLPPFLRSVAAIRTLGVGRIYPGHGEVIDVPERAIDRFEAHHARRARQIRAALAEGTPTAFEIARTIHPRLPLDRLMQALTEVLGHLDLLQETGAVSTSTDGVIRWHLNATPEGSV